jgi:CheY-like chemotaxis protein
MTKTRLVLVVDDDDDIRDLLSMLLELRGYRAEPARDGVEALERLEHGERPAVILLDMMMPRLDGEGLIAEVQRNPGLGKIPIVLVSGHHDVRQKAAELKAAGFLVKPIAIDDLLALVSELDRKPPSSTQ